MKRLLLLLLAAASLLAAMPSSGADRPRYGGTLRVQVREAVFSVDPADGKDSVTKNKIAALVFDRLTRIDAIALAGAVLQATEDTFHFSRCGRLRAVEAKEVLVAIQDVDLRLNQLREHALADLLNGVCLGDEPANQLAETVMTPRPRRARGK